jgi:hypothetical protein
VPVPLDAAPVTQEPETREPVTPEAASALSASYTEAVNSGDDVALRALHEPDALIWHNTDGREQTLDKNLRGLGHIRGVVTGLAVTDVRTLPTPEGFVRTHRMVGETSRGPLSGVSCLVVTMSAAGRIARVEEYLDGASFAVLAG